MTDIELVKECAERKIDPVSILIKELTIRGNRIAELNERLTAQKEENSQNREADVIEIESLRTSIDTQKIEIKAYESSLNEAAANREQEVKQNEVIAIKLHELQDQAAVLDRKSRDRDSLYEAKITAESKLNMVSKQFEAYKLKSETQIELALKRIRELEGKK